MKTKISVLCILSVLFSFLPISQSNVAHADPVTLEVCTGDGCAEGTYSTVGAAVIVASPGDTVQIDAGSYDAETIYVGSAITISCQGGAILNGTTFALTSSAVTIDGCTFTKPACLDEDGADNAAITTSSTGNPSGAWTITNNTFTNYNYNIYLRGGSSVYDIEGNTINASSCSNPSPIEVGGSGTIDGNTINANGGGIATMYMPSSSTITISNNNINRTSDGLGMSLGGSGAPTENVDFDISGNTLGEIGSGNVGIRIGNFDSDSSFSIHNNIFIGAGIEAFDSDFSNASILHNTFYEMEGSAFRVYVSGASATNVTFKYNIFDAGIDGWQSLFTFDSGTSVTGFDNSYNAIYNASGVDDITQPEAYGVTLGAGTIDGVAPGFTDPSGGDFSLLPSSYMIGRGDDGSDLGAIDFTGTPSNVLTVCDSGCEYTSISEAIAAAAPGGEVDITSNLSLDTTVTIDKSVDLECSNGVTLTRTAEAAQRMFEIAANNVTINNCIFASSFGDNPTMGIHVESATGATITNNTFQASLDDTYQVQTGEGSAYLIQGNTFYGTDGGSSIAVFNIGTIDTNTFHVNGGGAIYFYAVSAHAGTVDITNNTIISDENDESPSSIGISLNNEFSTPSINVSGNTIKPADGKIYTAGISISTMASPLTITNNKIIEPGASGYSAISVSGDTLDHLNITHNTLYRSTSDSYAIYFNSASFTNSAITDNIIYGFNQGFTNYQEFTDPGTLDYNMFYNTTTPVSINGNLTAVDSHSTTTVDPSFSDISTYDFSLAPYSTAIGAADDASDLGAVDYVGTRRTTIYVDDDGTINHTADSPVDFNDIGSALDAAITGDTVQVAAGTYAESVSVDGKNITLTGAGSVSTTIDADGETSGISLTGVDGVTISGFTIENTDVPGGTYSVTNHPYAFGGHDYTSLGGAPGSGMLMLKGTSGNPSNDIVPVTSNDYDITSAITDSPQSWGVVLTSNSGMGPSTAYFTVYYDENVFADTGAVITYLDGLVAGFTNDASATDVFTYSDGSYHFNDPGYSVADGFQEPAINIQLSAVGAIMATNSDDNTFSNMAIQDNGIGFFFDGTSANNEVETTVAFSGNTVDLYSNSSGSNNIGGAEDDYAVGGSGSFVFDYEGEGAQEGDSTPPVGLTALTSPSKTTTSVTLAWSAVTEENFNHYEIWYGTNSTDVGSRNGTATEWDNSDDAALATIGTTSTTVTSLIAGTTYYFKIWAIDDSDLEETVATLSVATSSRVSGGGGAIVIHYSASGPNEALGDQSQSDNTNQNNDGTEDITKQVVDTVDQVKIDKVVEKVASGETLTKNEKTLLAEQKAVETIQSDVETLLNLEPAVSDTGTPQGTQTLEQYQQILDSAKEIFSGSADADGDGILNAQEIKNGTDPLLNNKGTIKDVFAKAPEGGGGDSSIGKLKVAAVSSSGFVLSGTTRPNKEVTVKVGDTILKTTSDANGHYLIPVELAGVLTNGLIAVETDVNGQTSKILAKVEKDTIPQPTFELEGKNVSQIKDFNATSLATYVSESKNFKAEWVKAVCVKLLNLLGGTEYKNTVLATLETRTGSGDKVTVKGHALPGSTVVLAYKSVIYSSVVIADKNGNFTSELPKDLTAELTKSKDLKEIQHEFIAFAIDYKDNKVSPFTKGFFKMFN